MPTAPWDPSIAESEAARLDGPNWATRRGPSVLGALVLTALALAVGLAALMWLDARRDDEVVDEAPVVEVEGTASVETG